MAQESLSERIKRLREAAGYTKAGLGKKLGTSDVTIGYWESGEIKSVSHLRLMKLAETFGITVSELLDDPLLDKRFTKKRTTETSTS